MPKEGTHHYIAKKAQTLFIPKKMETYLYGSIAPDIFFFDFIKKSTVADRLHGKNGEATDRIFFTASDLWPKLSEIERLNLADFLAGFLTHIVTDRIFHPWVIYWSGGPGQEKKFGSVAHHFLETWLDIELESTLPLIKYNSEILSIYSRLVHSEQDIKRCAWQHKFIMARLDSPLFLWLSKSQPALLALSYKVVKKYLPQYNLNDLSVWRHPVTGDTKNLSYQDLLQQAIDLSAQLLKQINWTDLPSNDWSTLVGQASLSTNLVAVPFSDCRFQNEDYFKDLKVAV